MKAAIVNVSKKDYLQVKTNIFVWAEGKGMCQNGSVIIAQKTGWENDDYSSVKIHKSDIPNLIKIFQSQIPTMTEENSDAMHQEIKKQLGVDYL